MDVNADEIRNIAECWSDKYNQEILMNHCDPDKILADWQESMKFLFGRTFFRGRNDEMSDKARIAAINILDDYKPTKNDPEPILNSRNWDKIELDLGNVLGKGKDKAGNKYDIRMVMSILEFISAEEKKNVVAYSISRIKHKQLVNHFKEIVGRDLCDKKKKKGIYEVGFKIGSFYLRDVVNMYAEKCLLKIKDEELIYLQPIDTHVRQVSYQVRIIDSPKKEDIKDIDVRKRIVENCQY